jgi:hypothetical protein
LVASKSGLPDVRAELGRLEMLRETQSRSTAETATERQGTVPVTMRAIVQRINRKLAADGYRRLKQSRGRPWKYLDCNVGKWFLVDGSRNHVERTNVDAEKFAKELSVLKPWEKVGE